MRILIVDDKPTNRKLLRVTLADEALTTVEAGDGIEALTALDREPVDVSFPTFLCRAWTATGFVTRGAPTRGFATILSSFTPAFTPRLVMRKRGWM